MFIVGMPRSGNTLLSSVLSASRELCIAPELWFYNYWKPVYSFLDLQKGRDFDFFVERLLNSRRIQYTGLDITSLHERLHSLSERNFHGVFETVLDAYRLANGKKPRVGEKTPGQFAHVGEMLSAFPDAKIIWMMRDPRAVASSVLRAQFGTTYVSQAALNWRRAAVALQSWMAEDRVLCIRYEDLTEQPTDVVARLGEFLGVECDVTQISNNRNESVPVSSRGGWALGHFERAMGPVNSDSVHQWATFLSPIQVAAVEFLAWDVAASFGYARQSPDVSFKDVSRFVSRERLLARARGMAAAGHRIRRSSLARKLCYVALRRGFSDER